MTGNWQDVLMNGDPLPHITPIQRGPLRLRQPPVVCDTCQHAIDPMHVRGRLSDLAGVTTLDYVGLCLDCQRATPRVIRLKPDQVVFEKWTPQHGWRRFQWVPTKRRPHPLDLVGWLRLATRVIGKGIAP